MAKPLPAVNVRDNGTPHENAAHHPGSLRGMLATAEFWKEETASEVDVTGDEPEVERGKSMSLEQLQRENLELRALIEDLHRGLENKGGSDAGWEERQREYDSLLEEKSEVIRTLHQKIQELQARPAAPALTPKEDELIALSDELERERCQLEQDRRDLEEEQAQLKEDEKNMMQQMREMEVQMARERAELARHRNELQRLHTEIHHELELAARDGNLRERLQPLQRRHQEMTHRRGEAPREQPAPPPQQAPAKEVPERDNGLLRRLFG